MAKVIKLFTSESPDDIQRKGGSFAWKLNASKANLCSYALLYHNARARTGARVADHGDLFLVGRISGLAAQPEGRHAIIFDAVAVPTRSDSWPSTHQNPVNYAEVDESLLTSLKFDAVELGAPVVQPAAAEHSLGLGLTIAKAKELLATHYGVTADAIEIIIRG